jgi:hypothetical protein
MGCPAPEIRNVSFQGQLQNLADFTGLRNGAHGPADVSNGVKMRKPRSGHISAGLPLIADIARRGWQGRKVPHSDIRADDVLALFRKRYPYQ